ncbi:ABC transporter ATP-binding protein [Halobellus rarus]|uniref:Probable branched-chain amino acid transport ATP-binding protein LivG n=1 Tax=Halobellus rarus TaxID=1126237 RepID=A0ABD6CL11_9EURY|nr:ABC transporter ATP-binding protein [Halobellus rarus]
MTDTEPLLRAEGLTKRFGEFTAVDDVDFTVQPNETKALIGPNGAGKTTFQNLLTGKLSATEGTITFDGEDVTHVSPHERAQRGIIRKYQITSVYEDETVLENMRLAFRSRASSPWELLRTHDDSDIRDRIEELLSIANLHDEQHTTVGTLSHGEKQWLEIVMAVGAEPELLLLDEPTSGISVGETDDTVDLIEEIRSKENVAIVVIEHDMDFIRKVSESITVLDRGEIIASGTIDEIENDETVQRIYLGEAADA